jgi:oligopeptidase A
MADSPHKVLAFLNDLAGRARPQAQRELAELREFAHDQFGWTMTCKRGTSAITRKNCASTAINSRRKNCGPISQLPAFCRDYSRWQKNYSALLFIPLNAVETWHPDVQVYEVLDTSSNQRGRFYLDLYARPHKRGGAWMDGCLARRKVNEALFACQPLIWCAISLHR